MSRRKSFRQRLAEKSYRRDVGLARRNRHEQVMQYQNQLQSLLMELATSFINLPLDDINTPIHQALRRMGRFVNADRVYVFEYDFEGQVCNNTHEWCEEGILPQIDILQRVSLNLFVDWVQTHLRGETMYIPDVLALPVGSGIRAVLEPQQIKSLIAVPMMNTDECVGFVGFDSVREYHTYSLKEQQLLTVFA